MGAYSPPSTLADLVGSAPNRAAGSFASSSPAGSGRDGAGRRDDISFDLALMIVATIDSDAARGVSVEIHVRVSH